MIFRSLLFVPGSNPDRVEKAFSSSADAVIIDLEDSVPVTAKVSVRDKVADLLEERSMSKKLFIRVNGIETDFCIEDIRSMALPSVYGIMIPKAESPDKLKMIDAMLTDLEKERSIPQGSINILPQIESALGISKALEIGLSTPRVLALTFGAADLAMDIGYEVSKTGEELLFIRSWLVLQSRLAGIYAIDSPFIINLKDSDSLNRECRLGRQLGMRGKLCIHPAQLSTVNYIFSPSSDEIARARMIVETYEGALSRGEGTVMFHGDMIDLPIYNRAKQISDYTHEGALNSN
ncbi:MAG: CoA ester lyase [Syntrophales bacterium]|nr:CoA ester lyase [Syntrophales bacterium]